MKINPHVLGRMISHPVISTSRSLPLYEDRSTCPWTDDIAPVITTSRSMPSWLLIQSHEYGGLSAETQANGPALGTAEPCSAVFNTLGWCASLQALGPGRGAGQVGQVDDFSTHPPRPEIIIDGYVLFRWERWRFIREYDVIDKSDGNWMGSGY